MNGIEQNNVYNDTNTKLGRIVDQAVNLKYRLRMADELEKTDFIKKAQELSKNVLLDLLEINAIDLSR